MPSGSGGQGRSVSPNGGKVFDLCVIGSGPAGQKCAIQAAKIGKRVCVVEQRAVLGGVAVNTGTIPSKALREAIVRALDRGGTLSRGESTGVRGITFAKLLGSTNQVVNAEVEMIRGHLDANGIEVRTGKGSFRDANTIEVTGDHTTSVVRAEKVLLAVGTQPAEAKGIGFDGLRVVSSDQLLDMPSLPRSMIVVGGGVIGTEYASMLQELGIRVTLIEGRPRLLDFVDAEIVEALQYHLRQAGATLRLGEKVVKLRLVDKDGEPGRVGDEGVEAFLESGKMLRADALLYCVGRQGCTDGLNLEAAGLTSDDRGRIEVDAQYRTKVPHIYAAGDVIGFPALASTSMEQGRLAACNMFGVRCEVNPAPLPYGIYAIPEISMVGWTEERLTKEGIPYEAGVAQYKEIARGQLLEDEIGMLKLLVHQESRTILGVHAIGTGATELIHIGQAVMAFNGKVDYFINNVFNYPTLAEAYKVAALNGLNKLRHV